MTRRLGSFPSVLYRTPVAISTLYDGHIVTRACVYVLFCVYSCSASCSLETLRFPFHVRLFCVAVFVVRSLVFVVFLPCLCVFFFVKVLLILTARVSFSGGFPSSSCQQLTCSRRYAQVSPATSSRSLLSLFFSICIPELKLASTLA